MSTQKGSCEELSPLHTSHPDKNLNSSPSCSPQIQALGVCPGVQTDYLHWLLAAGGHLLHLANGNKACVTFPQVNSPSSRPLLGSRPWPSRALTMRSMATEASQSHLPHLSWDLSQTLKCFPSQVCLSEFKLMSECIHWTLHRRVMSQPVFMKTAALPGH